MPPKQAPSRVQARVDLHCHSAFSKDAVGSLDEIATAAQAKGLTGVCLTEHDSVGHHDALDAWNEDQASAGFRFFPGIEVSARGGHVLGIGVRDDMPLGATVADTIAAIHDAGGVAVPAHPYRRGSGIGGDALDAVRKDLYAVEVWNAQELGGGNKRTASWALANGKGGTGGSDCHQVHDVGNGYTECLEPIPDTDALLRALRSGDTWGVGGRTPFATLARQASRNVVRRMRGRL